MTFLYNANDATDLLDRYGARQDNLGRAVRILARVVSDANENSDGWHCWRKPSAAASKLQDLIARMVGRSGCAPPFAACPTDAELRAALTPLRAFYTRTRAKVLSYPPFPENP